jgi:hypothetical protein
LARLAIVNGAISAHPCAYRNFENALYFRKQAPKLQEGKS